MALVHSRQLALARPHPLCLGPPFPEGSGSWETWIPQELLSKSPEAFSGQWGAGRDFPETSWFCLAHGPRAWTFPAGPAAALQSLRGPRSQHRPLALGTGQGPGTLSWAQPGAQERDRCLKQAKGLCLCERRGSRARVRAVLMRSRAPCQDIKWNRIPETSFNQQISKVRITLSSPSLAKVNSARACRINGLDRETWPFPIFFQVHKNMPRKETGRGQSRLGGGSGIRPPIRPRGRNTHEGNHGVTGSCHGADAGPRDARRGCQLGGLGSRRDIPSRIPPHPPKTN